MATARVWTPSEPAPAEVWRRRMSDAGADVGAVLEPGQEDLLGELIVQLEGGDLICAYSPVSDALKVVADGLVVDSVDRNGIVELRAPFAFRIESALAVVASLDPEHPIDLLESLAAGLHPLPFRGDRPELSPGRGSDGA